MKKFQLSKDVYVKTIAIKVKDVEKMVNFYKNVLGFVLKLEENNLSILGSQEKNSRLLVLEETDTQDEVVGAFEKAFCFSLLIPTEEEFGSVLRRISSHHYPIEKTVQSANRRSVFIVDPEGNELEISVKIKGNNDTKQTETFSVQSLVHESKVLYSSLSREVHFDRLKIPMENRTGYFYFYKDILGMGTDQVHEEDLLLDNGGFVVHLDDSVNIVSENKADQETLGIDFFVIPLKNKEDMLELKEHLEREQQDFFVDKKVTILTIFDPGNIEWWFVRNE